MPTRWSVCMRRNCNLGSKFNVIKWFQRADYHSCSIIYWCWNARWNRSDVMWPLNCLWCTLHIYVTACQGSVHSLCTILFAWVPNGFPSLATQHATIGRIQEMNQVSKPVFKLGHGTCTTCTQLGHAWCFLYTIWSLLEYFWPQPGHVMCPTSWHMLELSTTLLMHHVPSLVNNK